MAQPRLAKNSIRGATATVAPAAQVAKMSPEWKKFELKTQCRRPFCYISHQQSFPIDLVVDLCTLAPPSPCIVYSL